MTFSPLDASKLFGMLALSIHEAEQSALKHAAKLVLNEIKAEIGTYQGAAGQFPAWAPLADATKEDRARKGFPTDEPLLRTGELRDSYEYTVQPGNAYVGSNDMKAVWQELGTRTIPPRSVIGMAAVHKEKEIVEETGRLFYGVLTAQSAAGVKQVIASKK